MYNCYASCPSCGWRDLPYGESLDAATQDALSKHKAESPQCVSDIGLSALNPDDGDAAFIFQGLVTPDGERRKSNTVSHGSVNP